MRVLTIGVLSLAMLVMAASSADSATQVQIDTTWNKGVAWLLTHQRADGSWRSRSGTEVAATAAAVEALAKVGVRGYPFASGVAWLSNAEAPSVDSLARKSLALQAAALNVTPHLQKLVDWRNPNRSWGAYDQFVTSFPDTPLAVAAIRSAQYGYSDDEYKDGLCAMVSGQKTGDATIQGSWSYINTKDVDPQYAPPASAIVSAILPTTRNILEIHARLTYPDQQKRWTEVRCTGTRYDPQGANHYPLETARDTGITWLLNFRKNQDGGFGEQGVSTVVETALAYEVLASIRPSDPATGTALDYLRDHRSTDGSWNGDALQTAFVLKVFPGPTGGTLADAEHDSIPDAVEPLVGTNPGIPDSRWLANPYDGDLNQDGVVDVWDVVLAQEIVTLPRAPTAIELRHGDVAPPGEPNGVIDGADVERIQQKVSGEQGF